NTIFTTSSPQNSDADIIEALRIENCVDILAKNCFIYEVVNTAATSGVVQDISEGGFINNIYFRGAGALGVFQAIGARASLPKLYVDYIDTDTQIAYLLIGGSFYIGYIEVATSIKLVQAQNTSFSIGTINAPNLSFSLQGGLNVNFRIGTLNFGYGIPLGSTFLVDAYAYIDNFNQTMATGGVIPFGGNNFLYIDNANIVDGMDVGTGLNTTFAINKLTYTENGSLGAIINCKSCVVRINTMTVNGGSAFYINSSPASSFPGLVAQVQKLYLNGATITRGNMDFSAINIASVVCVGTGVEYLSANGGEALVINDLVATNILAMFDSTASSTTKTQLYFNRLELPALISSTTNQSGLTIVGDYLTTTNVAITSGGSSSPRN
ncbi:hypothetical protein KDA11_03480, partial [Candidatus Saccharibacteria bacterium]|nr:hypothetical protein [Candidatus Saccharibacteria bacterium]